MKYKTLFLTTMTVITTLALCRAADITGKVSLKGTPPPEKTIDALKTDPNCGPLSRGEVPKTRFYIVGKNNELADTVVSLKDIKGKSKGETIPPLLIDQVGCEYLPYVAACQTRQKVQVRNSDPVLHNVHVTPGPAGNKESNKAQLPRAADLEYMFENPEPFLRFKCDVHPWMFTYISIFDHPYFAVTGKDGSFMIKDVPPGRYTIEAAHRKAGSVTREVEVSNANLTLDFVIEAK